MSFEPISDAYAQLASTASDDPLWQTRLLALADRSGRATLNVSANSFSSSLLPIAPVCVDAAPEAAYVRTEEVEIGTLDELGLSQEPTLLKIDVQGCEPQVLQGGTRFLRDVLAVELELSLVPLYEGQELAADVCARLRRHALVPVAFETEFVHPLNRPAAVMVIAHDQRQQCRLVLRREFSAVAQKTYRRRASVPNQVDGGAVVLGRVVCLDEYRLFGVACPSEEVLRVLDDVRETGHEVRIVGSDFAGVSALVARLTHRGVDELPEQRVSRPRVEAIQTIIPRDCFRSSGAGAGSSAGVWVG